MSTELFHFSVAGRGIAYRLRHGAEPTLVFLSGYASDMEGAKAQALDNLAERRGLGMLRFDYSGTGSSSGNFEDGTLVSWLDEALAAIDQLTSGSLLIVGSSMGGWIALHVALKRSKRVQALVGIAAAPDFTDWGFRAEDTAELLTNGRLEQGNAQDLEQTVFTAGFYESCQRLRLLGEPIGIDCPVRLVHGECDEEVPLEIAFRTMKALRSGDVQINVIKGGGHRLSQPHEIDTILRTVTDLLERAP